MKKTSEELKSTSSLNQDNFLRDYILIKRKALRNKYFDKWLVTVFFGLVAGILYLLIGSLEPDIGYLVTAAINGYAGESFVMKILNNGTQDIQWSKDEFQKFQQEFMEKSKRSP